MNFRPRISVLVPVHNEKNVIQGKLENVAGVSYPKDLYEVIVVDDCSDDGTLSVVEDFVKNRPDIDAKIVKQEARGGKAVALNRALSVASSEIVVVTDADTLWPQDILEGAMPYLADPDVGAVTSMGVNKNEEASWVTKGEKTYLGFSSLIRMGESKMYSTIRFEGGFCAYKREAFDQFDCESGADDSGTALSVVQKGKRAILVPEAVFYTWFPTSLTGKIRIKVRRAVQLIGLWFRCMKLLIGGKLLLPKRIAVSDFVLFVVNPLVFLCIVVVGIASIVLYPYTYFSLALVLLVLGSAVLARRVFSELVVDNLILVSALFSFLLGRRYVSWESH